MSHRYHAIVKPSALEDFNDEMNTLRILLQDHFVSISDKPDGEAIKAIIDTGILRDYGEALTAGLRRHLHEKAGFLLTSLEFEGFEESPVNEDEYFLRVSLQKGDVTLLDFFIIDEDLETAIEKDILNETTGMYKDCPAQISDWRAKSPEQRTPQERGMLINSASDYSWDQAIDFSHLKKEIANLKPRLNQPDVQSKREIETFDFS